MLPLGELLTRAVVLLGSFWFGGQRYATPARIGTPERLVQRTKKPRRREPPRLRVLQSDQTCEAPVSNES
jgi:hypothetical protein